MAFKSVPSWIDLGPENQIGDTYLTPDQREQVWICYYPGDVTISLDGNFTASDLRELISMVENSEKDPA